MFYALIQSLTGGYRNVILSFLLLTLNTFMKIDFSSLVNSLSSESPGLICP